MAGSSSSAGFRAAQPFLATGLVLALGSGCTTGMVLGAGRYHEQVLHYDEAHTDGDRLLLAYRVELADGQGGRRGVARREAALQLADLRADPEIVVEEFPVTAMRVGEGAAGDGGPLEMIVAGSGAEPAGPYLALDVEEGRDVAFALLGVENAAPARFYSGALYRRHYEWWVYPLLPLTATLDLLLLLPQIAVAPPLFVMNE